MERRKSRREREVDREKAVLAVVTGIALIVAVLMIAQAFTPGPKAETVQEAELQVTIPTRAVAETETEVATEETADATGYSDPYRTVYPYNTMSADWGADDMQGFVFYEIPGEYEFYGGLLPDIVQRYTYCICKQKDVDYATTLAMIETESAYKWDAKSSGGAVGYLQIIPAYHEERMKRLGVYDLQNPYQNIRTGVDYIAELLKKYGGSYENALTAYRWGPTGADREYFSKGKNGCEYSKLILDRTERIKKEIEKNDDK